MFSNIGTVEIIIIAVVIMVLFGAKKLPEFAKGIGDASKEFKKGLTEDDEKPKKKKKEETD